MAKTVKVPPDGGYGWVIVCANALSNLMIIPLMQSFGLIFKDTFQQMGLSATQGSLIINLNAAFGMMTGLINGVLLKIFGYRKIAFAGSFLLVVGIVLTSFAKTFTHFMLAYGVVTSLGIGLSMSAYSLALNSYFRKNRGKAVGYAMTITGLGPILMPQLISILIKIHTIQGTTLIIGGIAAHGFIAAALLHPVKWHMKKEIIKEEKIEAEEEEEEKKDEVKLELMRSDSQVEPRLRKDSTMGSTLSIDHDVETAAIYGTDSILGGSVLSLNTTSPRHRTASVVSQTWKRNSNLNLQRSKSEKEETVYNDLSEPIKKKPLWKRILNRLSKFFDLDLFKDPIYVNIMIGMSLAVFAELNFSLLTAFILADLGLETDQIATFMSILGIADICFRFLAPYIGDYLNKPARIMYTLTLFLLMITRFSLLLSSNVIYLYSCSLGLGIAKGIRTVYMSLVIPNHVPIEKLASAAGIQMMVNGCFIMIGGPVIGLVRDLTGSYNMCVVIINCITCSTIIIWTIEFVICKLKKKEEEDQDEVSVELEEQQSSLLDKKQIK